MNERNKMCPLNHGLRCKDIEDCAFWCEWEQCAIKTITIEAVLSDEALLQRVWARMTRGGTPS